jgi:hypothetical protein
MQPARVAVLSALTVLVTGCAGQSGREDSPERTPRVETSAFDQLSGRQIAKETAEALEKVSSVRLEGRGRFRNHPTTMELSVDQTGTCAGEFEVIRTRFEFIHAPDGRWLFKGNARYWEEFGPRRHREEAVERFADRWVDVSEGDLSEDLKDNCDLGTLWEYVVPDDAEACVKGTGGPATDEPTVQVVCGESHVWVQASAPHRPVKYDGPHGDDIEFLTFLDYDQPLDVDLPPAEEIIDLTGSEQV